jgi:hypothetical protein
LTQLQRYAGFVFIREHGEWPVDVPGLVEAERADGGPAVLVRPDSYIAWAGTSFDREKMISALSEWTGISSRAGSPRLRPLR